MANERLALQPPTKQHMSNCAEPAANNKKPARTTQRDRIYDLLYRHRNEWVPLPAILELQIAQFGARIKELRELGVGIRNKKEIVNGSVHSWYMLAVPEPTDAADRRATLFEVTSEPNLAEDLSREERARQRLLHGGRR